MDLGGAIPKPRAFSSSVEQANTLSVAIEDVPFGSRIGTVNPQSGDYDDPTPDHHSWSKIDLTITREDGVVVDVELLRPDQWILDNDLFVGSEIPIHIEELEVHRTATVKTRLVLCPRALT